MQTFLRSLCRVLRWTLGLAAVLLFIFVAINAFDEDPSPVAKQLATPAPNPLKPEENLNLALMGFAGPSGTAPIAAGQAKVAEYEIALAAYVKDPKFDVSGIAPKDKGKLAFQGDVKFCRPLQYSCVARIEANKAEIEQLLVANRELYERYLGLHRLAGYYDTATPSVYLPIGYANPEVKQLFLANVALRAKANVPAGLKSALADLRDDVKTWRQVLIGDGSIISKMFAVASLHGDHAVLADIIADKDIDLTPAVSEIEAILGLINPADWKTGKMFVYEFRSGAGMLDNLNNPFFRKINATKNLSAESMRRLQELADTNPEAYFGARDAYQKWVRENMQEGLHYFYNPIGKILMEIAMPAYEQYPLRAYDGMALQRLVRLCYEIRSKNIDDKSIPSFIRENSQWAAHPVDGKPFTWDAQKREVAMQSLGGYTSKDRRFSFPVWNGAAK